MTSPHEPPYVPPPPGNATPRYRRMWDSLVRERPEVAEQVYAVVNEDTDFEEACDRIAGECVLAISFGLIARARAEDMQLVMDVGTLYAIRATGGEVSPEVWDFARDQADQRLKAIEVETLNAPGNPTSEQYMALCGIREAADCRADDSLQRLVSWTIKAWDEAVCDQHGAVTFFAADITVTQTKAAGRTQDERAESPA